MDEAQMMKIAVLIKEMLEPRFQGIEKSMGIMQATIGSMQTSITDMNTRMETKFQAVEASIVDLQTNMASVNAKLTQPGEDDANAFIIGICNIMRPFTLFWVPLHPKSRAKAD
jgi:hypothetical protein